MKIAYLGNFDQPWETEAYIARALERAGCEVQRIDEHDLTAPKDLSARVDSADVFLFAKGRVGDEWDRKITLRLIDQIRPKVRKVVSWSFDLLYPDYSPERFRWASAVAPACDLFCTTDGATAPFLANCKVLRQGVGDDVRQGKFDARFACEVLWLGGAYRHRRKFAEQLQAHFWRRLWVVESGIRGDMLNDVMASCKVVIGPHWPAHPQYWSNRIYCVAGYGGCMVCPEVEGMAEEGWRPGVHYRAVPAGDIDATIAAVEDLCSTDGMPYRHDMAKNAKRFVAENFTYDHRVKQLLEWMAICQCTNE